MLAPIFRHAAAYARAAYRARSTAEVIPRLGIRKSARWVQQPPSRAVSCDATRRDFHVVPELPKRRSALWKRVQFISAATRYSQKYDVQKLCAPRST